MYSLEFGGVGMIKILFLNQQAPLGIIRQNLDGKLLGCSRGYWTTKLGNQMVAPLTLMDRPTSCLWT